MVLAVAFLCFTSSACTVMPKPSAAPENFCLVDSSRVQIKIPSTDIFLDGQRIGNLNQNGSEAFPAEYYDIFKLKEFKHLVLFTITKLTNGKLLVAGGHSYNKVLSESSWLYDPAVKQLRACSKMCLPRFGHRAILLPDGRVLIVGGADSTRRFSEPAVMAEIYNPSTNKFEPAAKLVKPGDAQIGSATLLSTGNVLITGANSGHAELYDTEKNLFTYAGQMNEIRGGCMTFVLPDGRVLIYGGKVEPHFVNGWSATPVELKTAEIYPCRNE